MLSPKYRVIFELIFCAVRSLQKNIHLVYSRNGCVIIFYFILKMDGRCCFVIVFFLKVYAMWIQLVSISAVYLCVADFIVFSHLCNLKCIYVKRFGEVSINTDLWYVCTLFWLFLHSLATNIRIFIISIVTIVFSLFPWIAWLRSSNICIYTLVRELIRRIAHFLIL